MRLNFLTLFIFLISLLICIGCSSSTDSNDESNFDLIQPTLEANTADGLGKPISAQTLFDNMNDGDATNDYFILSVRSAETYAIGHIPGAINVYWKDVAKEANLALLPTDQPIAIYCYTGHTGQTATTALINLGYEAVNLKFGFMSWTQDGPARVQNPFIEEVDGHDFATETTINTAGEYELPDPEWLDSQDADEIMQAAAEYVLSNIAPVTKAQDLFDNLNDGNTSNDPQILSVRSAETYALGHIPGAINVYWKDVAKIENLKKIDPTRQVVVYCYTGHTQMIAAAALNMLGYDAISMKFGMMSWTKDATIRVQTPFTEGVDSKDFPFNTGSTP